MSASRHIPDRERIARINDLVRTSFIGVKVVMTEGIRALPKEVREAVITGVRTFDDFTPGNDPYGERDFGSLTVPGAGRVFWKIDYYDLTETMHSPDPSHPKLTRRVLTIMLAGEY